MKSSSRQWLWVAAWAAAVTPALAQVVLLLTAIFGRYHYPYDLEWTEGGMLNHAARIAEGSGVYLPPSIEFIPYLYTPLYPMLIAAVEPLFGITYQGARAISIFSLFGTTAVMCAAIIRHTDRGQRGQAWVGAGLAVGAHSAAYPFVEGWYDIARADSLFLLMVIGGLLGAITWSRSGAGWRGHAKVAAAAAILALSFFCKQTGIFYVAAGGLIVLISDWRRAPVYVAVSGTIGLGGTWLLNRATDGWFWTYIYEVHQAHDIKTDRFFTSFASILGEFPVIPICIAVGLAIALIAWAIRRTRPRSCRPLLIWSGVYALSCIVGAVGWATQWAHFNAYMPALLTGAIAAGATIPAVAGVLGHGTPTPRPGSSAIPLVLAGAIASQLIVAWWNPHELTPSAEDKEAGDRLIAHLREIPGEILIPFHPWYGHLAGKRVCVHRMGVWDVTYRKPGPSHKPPPPWKVRGLSEWIRERRFAAIVWDNRAIIRFPGIKRGYRVDEILPRDMRPKTYTGAQVVPHEIWVPSSPVVPPEGAKVMWNFEKGNFDGWIPQGKAWGKKPASGGKIPGQKGTVRRYAGRYYLSSMHGGDAATGRLASPEFTITGSRISLRLSGGKDSRRLRAALYIEGKLIDYASPPVSSEKMVEVGYRVASHRGKRAQIILIDRAVDDWGHLNIDEIWMWD